MTEDYQVHIDWDEGSHTFRFIGGPLSNPSACSELFAAYGYAAASWARLETHIEIIALYINREEHSTEDMKLWEPHHPRSIQEKIRLVRRYFNRHPALINAKEWADPLFEQMLRQAKNRNEILHSVVEDFLHGHVILNGIFSKPNKNAEMKRLHVPLSAFREWADNINSLNRQLSDLSKPIFVPENFALLRMRQ